MRGGSSPSHTPPGSFRHSVQDFGFQCPPPPPATTSLGPALSTVGKALEKIVHKHVFNFFHENQVITSLQSGFVPGDSTINQSTDLYNTFFCHALDEGKEVRAVFCDISKACDRVWHKGLLYNSLQLKSHDLFYNGLLII